MVRFSLYKRRRAKGVYYYVRFWNTEKKRYDAGLSIETLRAKLGDDGIRRIRTRSAAAAIAVRDSSYVKLKNKTKKNSIGRDHCLNMLGTFKRNFMRG